MVVEYNTEKKHTEYKIIVEDGRVSKIIVQIPKNEDVEEEEYEINSDTLQGMNCIHNRLYHYNQ